MLGAEKPEDERRLGSVGDMKTISIDSDLQLVNVLVTTGKKG
jgi:hypothetical protein